VLPYILIEYPIGVIADEYLGEKEIAFFGFIIMALGFGAFAYIGDTSIPAWIVLILIANTGGALVEVSTETHFFKHVSVTDSDLVSTFRMLRPIAAIAAPAVASLALIFVPFQELFIVFGLILVCGLPFVLGMTDTR
jgi:dipeptide/tripeptide permease